MSNQLIKETALRREQVFPKNYILNLKDKDSGANLEDILKSFNMLFLSYLGNKVDTRKQVPMSLRHGGLWITYIVNSTVVTEWYDNTAVDDYTWGSDSYWREGSNMLVGDISISKQGTWVINGEDTGISPKGDKGDSPIIRIYNNRIQVSYDEGNTYTDLNDIPVFTLFRFNSNTNTHLVSYDLGLTWLDILPDKVYYKFRYNQSTNTYLVSTDLGKTWSNVSAEKVFYKFRFNPDTNTHQVSTDLGNNWVDISTEKVFYKFRTNENKLQVSTDLGTTWEDCSEQIAAWFRWTSGDTADSVGKILISRDELKTWTDLSPNITNNLRIKGYVATVGDLPSSAALGDIYMVGPTYDESDTTHDYPHYRMWVKLSSGWVDNGEYLSNIQISLTTGQETGITMSLKAITDSIAAETARAKAAEETNAAAIEAEAEKLTQLESKTNKENTISTETSNVMQGAIYPDGSFHDDGNNWEYVLFLVAPNDKITFKASGYGTNVISYYKTGQTPSEDSYIKGMLPDGDGSTSYKEYVSVAEDFSIAAVCWYRPYGEPSISIKRTTSIENFNYIINDYEEKFIENNDKHRIIIGGKGLYNIIGEFIGPDGGVNVSEDYCLTDFILIDKSNDIIIINGSTGNTPALICLYDKDKNFIADSSKTNTNNIHIKASEIPEDAVYFRSCTRKETLDSIVVYNNIGYSFQPFYQNNINRINNLIVNDKIFSTNEEVNTYIKEVYAPLYQKTNNHITIRIAAVSQSSGKYYNGVMMSENFIFYDSGYETAEDAIAAANQYDGILSYKGNYIIVDFTSIKTSFDKIFIGDYYDITKVFNSPNIENFLNKENLAPFVGNSSIKKIEIGKHYAEINAEGKIIINDSGTYNISTKINIAKGDIIKVTGSGSNSLMIAEYKDGSEPTPLSFIGGTLCENRVVKEYEYVCQENGYVLICWASVYAEVTSYTHITGGRLKAVENSEEKISNIIDIHTPLNILIFGDSITDTAEIEVDVEDKTAKTTNYKLPYLSNGYTNKEGEVIRFSMWPALLRKAFNTFDIRCYARYGATYVDTDANTVFRQNLSDQIALAFNDLSNPNGVFMTQGNYIPDIVIFALSANDSNTPKDTFEIAMNKTIMSADGNSFDIEATLNNLDITQFNQAVRYAFLKLKNKFPYAQIFCICPPQRSAMDIGETQKEVDLKRMAQRYSINIIDAAATCGIVRDLEVNGGVDVYSKDGLHPNDYGQKLYARMVVNAIKNNMIDMTIFD